MVIHHFWRTVVLHPLECDGQDGKGFGDAAWKGLSGRVLACKYHPFTVDLAKKIYKIKNKKERYTAVRKHVQYMGGDFGHPYPDRGDKLGKSQVEHPLGQADISNK
jgi:hypothetical protein